VNILGCEKECETNEAENERRGHRKTSDVKSSQWPRPRAVWPRGLIVH